MVKVHLEVKSVYKETGGVLCFHDEFKGEWRFPLCPQNVLCQKATSIDLIGTGLLGSGRCRGSAMGYYKEAVLWFRNVVADQLNTLKFSTEVPLPRVWGLPDS